MSNEEIVCQRK